MSTTQTPPPEPALLEEPLAPPVPQPPPASAIRTTTPPEGGWEEGFPKVYFSVYEKRPPHVVLTTAEEAQIDQTYWMTIPPGPAGRTSETGYPKLFYNVNLPPVVVRSIDQELSLGSAWRPGEDLLPPPPGEGGEPDVPPVEIAPTSQSTPAAGGPYSFTVTITGSGTSGEWTATSDAIATWLTIDSPTTPQTVDGPVNYTVAANVGAARTANIYVNGQTHTVNQAGV